MAGKKAGKAAGTATAVKESEAAQESAKDEKKNGIFINGVSRKNVIPAKERDGVCVRFYLPKENTPENAKLREEIGVDDKVKYVQKYYENPKDGSASKGHIYDNRFDENKCNVLVGTVGKENEPMKFKADNGQEVQMSVAQLQAVVKANAAEYRSKTAEKGEQVETPTAEAAPTVDPDPTDDLY